MDGWMDGWMDGLSNLLLSKRMSTFLGKNDSLYIERSHVTW